MDFLNLCTIFLLLHYSIAIQVNKSAKICLTPNCIQISANFLKNINNKIDPCIDFYEYACGTWTSREDHCSEDMSKNTFSIIGDKNLRVLSRAIQNISFNNETDEVDNKVYLYFKSCMDEKHDREKLGGKPLKQLIAKFGGWTFNNSVHSGWNYQSKIESIANALNLDLLINLYVGPDMKNSSSHVVYIDFGVRTFTNKKYYDRNNITNTPAIAKIYDAHLKYAITLGYLTCCNGLGHSRVRLSLPEIWELAGNWVDKNNGLLSVENVNQDLEDVEKIVDIIGKSMVDVFNFEAELSRYVPELHDWGDLDNKYNVINLTVLEQNYPFLNWSDWFENRFALNNATLPKDQKIIVSSLDYLSNLTFILQNYTQNPEKKRILQNYFIWHVAKQSSSQLSQIYWEAEKLVKIVLQGEDRRGPRWKQCTNVIEDLFPEIAGRLFVGKKFANKYRKKAQQMMKNVVKVFKRNLLSLKWLERKTKEVAIKKVGNLRTLIGYPDFLYNKSHVNLLYKELKLTESYFENFMAYKQFALKRNLKKLWEPVDKSRWPSSSSVVNAYYQRSHNLIVILAGIMQPPFYNGLGPDVYNYGTIGPLMGHELIHGFDDQGRKFDYNGNFFQWWSNKSIKNFLSRSKCMEDQYSQYGVDGLKMNGKLTLGENIADNGGLSLAFQAYKAYTKANQPTLPGLNLTKDQIFFLANAQTFCSTDTKQLLRHNILNAFHTLDKFRVIGPLSNSKAFSKAYNCPVDSPMNPKNKCTIW